MVGLPGPGQLRYDAQIMKAVILMAGKGTRMAEYYDGPKQLLPVLGQPIVERLIDQFPKEIGGLVFVVGGPHEDIIRHHFSSGEYGGHLIEFAQQDEQHGVAHAFWQAESLVAGKWLGLLPDDIYGKDAFEELMQYDLSILAYRVSNPERFGVLVADENDYLIKAVEKPKEFVSDLVWTGAMVMDERFFEAKVDSSARGEYESPDVWMKIIEDNAAQIKIVETDMWLPINDKQQLEEAERVLSAAD